MNEHSIPFKIFISIAIGSLAILLLLFAITLDIFLTFRFIIGFYGFLALVGLVWYFIEQDEIKRMNDYATKTKLYQDRLAVIGEAQQKQRELLPKYEAEPKETPQRKSSNPEDVWYSGGQQMREALNDIDDSSKVDS